MADDYPLVHNIQVFLSFKRQALMSKFQAERILINTLEKFSSQLTTDLKTATDYASGNGLLLSVHNKSICVH
jgi:hypothetical protein